VPQIWGLGGTSWCIPLGVASQLMLAPPGSCQRPPWSRALWLSQGGAVPLVAPALATSNLDESPQPGAPHNGLPLPAARHCLPDLMVRRLLLQATQKILAQCCGLATNSNQKSKIVAASSLPIESKSSLKKLYWRQWVPS